jgi:hypothetical protein
MKRPETAKIRNIALVAHGSAGKTTLTEAVLFAAGATTRLGRVEDGTTTTDFDEDEIRQKISISTRWRERSGRAQLNLVDAGVRLSLGRGMPCAGGRGRGGGRAWMGRSRPGKSGARPPQVPRRNLQDGSGAGGLRARGGGYPQEPLRQRLSGPGAHRPGGGIQRRGGPGPDAGAALHARRHRQAGRGRHPRRPPRAGGAAARRPGGGGGRGGRSAVGEVPGERRALARARCARGWCRRSGTGSCSPSCAGRRLGMSA